MATLSLTVRDSKIIISPISHSNLLSEYTEGIYDNVTIEELVENSRKDIVPLQLKNRPKYCISCKVRPPSKKHRGIPVSTSQLEDGTIRYTIEPGYCCYGCVYRNIIDIVSRGPMSCPPRYHNSEPLLHSMYSTEYPGSKLIPCPNWTEHKKNGGQLDDENFYPKEPNNRGNNNVLNIQKEVISRGYVVIPVVNSSLQYSV